MNRKMMARYFIFAVLIASAALSFAGQQGLPIGGRLIDHQHTTYGDGGILQGLSPVGNFYIFGNNAGNIQISTSITGRLFAWKPASGTFIAGESTDDSFYVNNLGKYSWIGGYNSSSPGDYSLAFGTYAKNNRAASMLLGYYLKNNAGNSVMIGSGPGFGPQPYAVNDDTGSIKFFPFTTTSETRPMLNLKRDGTAEAVGVWNFISTPTIFGVPISTTGAVDTSKVLKAGDTMTGDLVINTALAIGRPIRASSPLAIASTTANMFLESIVNTTTGPSFFFQKNRGDSVSSATAAMAGDTIGAIHFRPQQSNTTPSYPSSAIIIAKLEAGANADSNDMPARLEFHTAADGTAQSVERMRIDNAGRVGISTGAPQATLDVNGALISTAGYISGSDFSVGVSTFIVKNGRVGVAMTGTPLNSSLEIWARGNSYPLSNLKIANYNGTKNTYMLNAEGVLYISQGGINDDLQLTEDGKFGIGTPPLAKLDVAGTIRSSENTSPATGIGLELTGDFAGGGTQKSYVTSYDRTGAAYKPLVLSGNNIDLTASGVSKIFLNSSGVGIGTATPAGKLHVQQAASDNYIILASSADTTPLLALDKYGHVLSSGASVSLGTCANGTVGPQSSDRKGTINFSGANSTCSVVFKTPYNDADTVCVLQSHDGTGVVNGVELQTHGATGFTFVPVLAAFGNGDHVHYLCEGNF